MAEYFISYLDKNIKKIKCFIIPLFVFLESKMFNKSHTRNLKKKSENISIILNEFKP